MKTVYSAFAILILAFSTGAFAQNFTASTFTTQHDKEIQLDNSTKWVFFASSMDGSDLLQATFLDLNINDNWLASRNAIYAADISRMPGLIARFFAIPRMRDLPYSIALDKEGDLTLNWQDRGEMVTIYKLDNLAVIETIQITDIKMFTQFIEKNLSQ